MSILGTVVVTLEGWWADLLGLLPSSQPERAEAVAGVSAGLFLLLVCCVGICCCTCKRFFLGNPYYCCCCICTDLCRCCMCCKFSKKREAKRKSSEASGPSRLERKRVELERQQRERERGDRLAAWVHSVNPFIPKQQRDAYKGGAPRLRHRPPHGMGRGASQKARADQTSQGLSREAQGDPVLLCLHSLSMAAYAQPPAAACAHQL